METNFIFVKPLVCHYVKYDSFFHCLEWQKNGLLWTMFLSELTQNEGIWNFYSSLTLNKWKLIWYSRSLWYAIVSNMTYFFFLFGMREKMACFELCSSSVVTQIEDIWNFHSSKTLNKGKLIWYSGSLWYAIVSKITHFFIIWNERIKWPVLNYVFHLYWRKMKILGMLMAL